jgi:hypothetical protein
MAGDREARNKIDWYDEIKTPLLTSLILCDTGKSALIERTEQLHKMAIENLTSFADEIGPLTDEEIFMSKVINSR